MSMRRAARGRDFPGGGGRCARREVGMTGGEQLYLIGVLVTFGVFAVALATLTWSEGRALRGRATGAPANAQADKRAA